ncbi:hypothetical protein SAMN04488117_10286 [Celeribacter baekdonensis]|uniref:Uncharacterized protein n=1 Tax=Celeribacter baekdonensis TaxID=875171 RepID=A0A1G7HUV6_9RHOB|nr:hypothetical protein [Celeribacter baekdonensis]SDF04252.1 hypothetical protein SAMN04488117_10286 [Celeribacter baekdonensis]
MKAVLAAALIALASPVIADDWYFEASLEGGAEFWTFTNEKGEVSPRRERGDEIWITRSDEVNSFGPDGSCDFNNCSVSVAIGGQAPVAGEQVRATFSNGETLEFAARGGEVMVDNYTTAGMGATNRFVQNIRAAERVEIGFGGRTHQFSLAGSTKALDAIRPYLR